QHHFQPGAAQLLQLAPGQVQRLDPGGAFVKGGDPRIAGELFHAVLGDVAVAAEALQRVVGALHAPLGKATLGDRDDETEQRVGALALGRVGGAGDDVDQAAGVVGQRAAAFDQRLLGQQHAAHVRVDDDRVGRLV